MPAIFFLLFISFTLFLTPFQLLCVPISVSSRVILYIQYCMLRCLSMFFLASIPNQRWVASRFSFCLFWCVYLFLCHLFLFLNYNLFLQAFAQLLQAPHDDAGVIMKERFPVPRLVICDQHGSQVGSYHNVQQMGGSLWMIVVCYLLSPGKDILGHSPMDVCT